MIGGFREFITRGNAVDMAVGIVIGAAFTTVIKTIVDKFINPLIAGIVGQPNFDHVLQFHVGAATVQPGAIITAVVNFLLVAAAIYFLIVVPMNKLNALSVLAAKRKADEDAAAEEKTVDPQTALLQDIRDLLASRNV
ncbi:large conductance mechanosensitive channel protein MscL [Nanchangia anserum]|uniref:Large-conductance mechanosensitive channel n=1 Tax=Nanchangia anserum TaxID=2692125 RepID=A0A8I0KNB9_9ACTO|nr:large conductance mechanosensitive channel protein MscL [Nanchangia anserum]MBD3689121.1 large conductance mechanosensitive channel protein MscL [Nanchangia anserum]QOX82630.1 large conductance mechanosensitive channel protein MscL [Nanchangia anserum]